MKKTIFLLTSCIVLNAVLSADMIDSMEKLSGWITTSDSGATITQSQDTGITGNAVKLDYNFGSGSWVQTGKAFSYKDLSAGDQIKFYYKGSGLASDLQVSLVDADGSVFTKTIPGVTNKIDWTELALSFAGGTPDLAYSYGGDNVLDKTKIAEIKFGAASSSIGEGSLQIDNVRLYLSNPALKVFADFDSLSSTNKFGGVGNAGFSFNATSSGTCSAAYVSTVTYAGGGALELKYDVSGTMPDGSALYSFYYTPLMSADLSTTPYLSFYVKGKQGGERFKIELTNNTIFVRVQNYVTVSTDWQEVRIPLSDFTNFVSSAPATGNLVFTFENNVAGLSNGPTQSTVFIDEIKFFQPGAANTVMETIDTMDGQTPSNGQWAEYGQYTGLLTSVSGQTALDTDKGIKITYNFLATSPVADRWAVMSKNSHPNVISGSVFKFKYKGSGGSDNIEFKVTDTNDVVFRKILYNAAETQGAWQTAEIPFSEMNYFTGSPKTLDLTKLKTVYFAIAKNKGSSGYVYLDELEFTSNVAQKINGSGVLLEKLDVPDNPISPNGDGSKDKARFIFKLKDSATVKFEVFRLSGESVYYFEKEMIKDGQEHVVEWDAKDKDGNRVANGLYIYSFATEGLGGEKEKINNIIGVIR